jgi:hypothetical protein
MHSSYYFRTKEGIWYPRFWLRFVLSFLIAVETFWYAGSFGADFNALFTQNDALAKFGLLISGSAVVHEWIFRSCNFISLRYDVAIHQKQFISAVACMGIIVPFIFMYGLGNLFVLMLGTAAAGFVASVSLMSSFLIMANLNMVYLCFYLFWSSKYLKTLEVYYGNQLVKLKVEDIAYLFYQKGTYFVTSHKGISYETSLEYNLEEFMALLDPVSFFMINEQMVISRKSCTAFSEDEMGMITVSLVPKPIIPQAMKGENDHGLFDHLNFN